VAFGPGLFYWNTLYSTEEFTDVFDNSLWYYTDATSFASTFDWESPEDGDAFSVPFQVAGLAVDYSGVKDVTLTATGGGSSVDINLYHDDTANWLWFPISYTFNPLEHGFDNGNVDLEITVTDYYDNQTVIQDSRQVAWNGSGGESYADEPSEAIPLVVDDQAADQGIFIAGVGQKWAKFTAVSGETYTVSAASLSAGLDVSLYLYDDDAATLIAVTDTGGAGQAEQLQWTCTFDGLYYLKVVNKSVQSGSRIPFKDSSYTYTLGVSAKSSSGTPGMISGKVQTSSGDAVQNARVDLKGTLNRAGLTLADGSFVLVAPEGSYDIEVTASGYSSYASSSKVTIWSSSTITHNVTLQGQSGAYSNTYYLPLVDYAGVTGVALSNALNSAQNAVRLTYYDNLGNELGEKTATLSGGGQEALAVSASGTTGWARVESAYPLVGMALLLQSGDALIDIDLKANLHKELVVPHVATTTGQWRSWLMVCNPASSQATLSVTHYAPGGTAASTRTATIPAGGATQVDLRSLLGEVDGGSLAISADQPVAAFLAYDGAEQGKPWQAGLSVTPQLVGGEGSYDYFLPYVAYGGGQTSGIALSNVDNDATNSVTVSFYDNDGALLATKSADIAARGQTTLVADAAASGSGWARIISSRPITGLGLVLGNDSPMVDLDLKSAAYTDLVVSHVVSDSDWTSRLMACNPGASQATVTLTHYDAAGSATQAGQTLTIPASGAVQQDLGELFTGGLGGGSIKISSTQPIAAFLEYDGQAQSQDWKAGLSVVPDR
jgi:hypothetical protein